MLPNENDPQEEMKPLLRRPRRRRWAVWSLASFKVELINVEEARIRSCLADAHCAHAAH